MDIKKSISKTRGEKFEKLIENLLVRMGNYDIKHSYYALNINDYIPDFIFNEDNNTKTAVEVKAYRPQSIPSNSVIESAVNQLKEYLTLRNINKGLLITSAKLNERYSSINTESNIEIWGLDIILEKSRIFPDIYNEIIDLFELEPSKKLILEKRIFLNGNQLLNELENIPKGRNGAYDFENWCIKALKYLFNDYLVRWEEQSPTTDELHRRDLICRVKDSQTEVWQFISHTIKSRYVVFEFKNYNQAITQREIITTERYLYPKALRNCAFIISREGVSLSAQQVIDGAMREHGKLIISLSIKDISQLLIDKDQGNDPNVYLFNKIDDFLNRTRQINKKVHRFPIQDLSI